MTWAASSGVGAAPAACSGAKACRGGDGARSGRWLPPPRLLSHFTKNSSCEPTPPTPTSAPLGAGPGPSSRNEAAGMGICPQAPSEAWAPAFSLTFERGPVLCPVASGTGKLCHASPSARLLLLPLPRPGLDLCAPRRCSHRGAGIPQPAARPRWAPPPAPLPPARRPPSRASRVRVCPLTCASCHSERGGVFRRQAFGRLFVTARPPEVRPRSPSLKPTPACPLPASRPDGP